MPWSTRFAAIVLPLGLAAACVAGPRSASAQQAAAEQPCSGTFCDWYYGGSNAPQTPAPQSAPTPLTVPSVSTLGHLFTGGSDSPQAPAQGGAAPAPAKRPLVAVQGGGLLGMARGEPAERCTGTFCDWYYGGPPPEQPAAQPAAAPPPEQASDPDAAPEPTDDARPTEAAERPEPQHCAAAGHDPWQCYR